MVNRAALIVIDGWGERKEEYGNAIMQADTPVMDGFRTGNYAVIDAAGLAVGLPPNTMGNSEVGHLTIGAGAVDYQDLVRINSAVADGSICTRPAFVNAFEAAKSGTGRLHLFGLLSDGGVHSHQEHLYAIVAAAKAAGVARTLLHVCMDGRDTPPTSGAGYMEALESKLAEIGYGEISTISGRYYAMDRDKRWERVQKAYDVMCRAPGECESVAAGGVKALLEARYERRRMTSSSCRRGSSPTAASPTATSSSASTSALIARARCSSASRSTPSLRPPLSARRQCASS